ncbi:MAG: hypothetical protein K0M55_19495 [Rhizobium sp.]|nr:hypothetical protein [Rhizobium sp.]
MNNAPLVSDLVGSVIKTFRRFEKTGVELGPNAVEKLIVSLRTIQELALDTEQELQIQSELRSLAFSPSELRPRHSADRTGNTGGANVVRLPTRVRVVHTPSDGGDAA